MIRITTKSVVFNVAVLTGVAGVFSTGFAAESGPEIEALRRQVQELDQKIRVLERRDELQAEAADEKAKTTPVISLGSSGLAIRSADTNFTLKIRGGAQFDSRFYFGESSANDTFLIRRVRPVFEGSVFKNFDYRVALDVASGVTSSSANNGFLLDAYVDARVTPWLTLRAGKFKEPVGLERLQSWNNLLFVERSYPTQLVPNRDVGFMAHGNFWNGALQYQLGVFNGTSDGGSSDFEASDNDKDLAARVIAHPFVNTDLYALRGLGLGVSTTIGEREGTPRTYLSAGGQRFFAYRSGVTAYNEAWRISPQAYYHYGPLGILAEYVASSQNLRQTTGGSAGETDEFVNTGWQVAVSYFLTGEENSLQSVTPKNPVNLAGGGWGAWEYVARVGQLAVDDDAFPVFADASVSAKSAISWGVGLNWHLNKNVKLQFSYEQTDFDTETDDFLRKGERVFLTRAQFTF